MSSPRLTFMLLLLSAMAATTAAAVERAAGHTWPHPAVILLYGLATSQTTLAAAAVVLLPGRTRLPACGLAAALLLGWSTVLANPTVPPDQWLGYLAVNAACTAIPLVAWRRHRDTRRPTTAIGALTASRPDGPDQHRVRRPLQFSTADLLCLLSVTAAVAIIFQQVRQDAPEPRAATPALSAWWVMAQCGWLTACQVVLVLEEDSTARRLGFVLLLLLVAIWMAHVGTADTALVMMAVTHATVSGAAILGLKRMRTASPNKKPRCPEGPAGWNAFPNRNSDR